ncbi:hypothetical protein ACFLQX_02880 [Bacteroidota bacterium]
MKRFVLVIAMLVATVSLFSQDISGKWNGLLVVPGAELRVDFNVSKTDDGYTSTLDSPDQGAYGIPTTSTVFKDKELTITIDDLMIEYTGKLNEEGVIKGTYTQAGQSFEMDLKKNEEE